MKNNEIGVFLSSRLDIWLWVARFYKTRKIASDSVKIGNIFIVGKNLVKPSSIVLPNNIILIKNDYVTRTILVKKISRIRRSYEQAKKLYEVLEESNSDVKDFFVRRSQKKSLVNKKKES